MVVNLVGGLEHGLNFSIYWESSSQVTHIFQRGRVQPPTSEINRDLRCCFELAMQLLRYTQRVVDPQQNVVKINVSPGGRSTIQLIGASTHPSEMSENNMRCLKKVF